MSRFKQDKPSAVVKKKDAPPGSITMQQYNVGYEMFRSQKPTGRIMAATRMTMAQVRWCALKGNKDMPSWYSRHEHQMALLGSQSLEVTEHAGRKAAQAISSNFDIVKAAQDELRVLLGTYRQHQADVVKSAQARGEKISLDEISMPTSMRETAKVLIKAKDLTDTIRTITALYGSHTSSLLKEDRQAGDTKEARSNLEAESLMSAAAALASKPKETGENDLDPLDTLFSKDLEHWTKEDFERYVRGESSLEEDLTGDVQEVVDTTATDNNNNSEYEDF